MKKENIIIKKSFAFAVRVVKLYWFLCENKKEFVLSKQLLRSGTSIGANVREAVHGQSDKDFLSKMNIALKESDESLYWIELLGGSKILDAKQTQSIFVDCNEIVSLLSSIVKTTRRKLENHS